MIVVMAYIISLSFIFFYWNSGFSDCGMAPTKGISGVGSRSGTKNWLRHFAHLCANFTGVKVQIFAYVFNPVTFSLAFILKQSNNYVLD